MSFASTSPLTLALSIRNSNDLIRSVRYFAPYIPFFFLLFFIATSAGNNDHFGIRIEHGWLVGCWAQPVVFSGNPPLGTTYASLSKQCRTWQNASLGALAVSYSQLHYGGVDIPVLGCVSNPPLLPPSSSLSSFPFSLPSPSTTPPPDPPKPPPALLPPFPIPLAPPSLYLRLPSLPDASYPAASSPPLPFSILLDTHLPSYPLSCERFVPSNP